VDVSGLGGCPAIFYERDREDYRANITVVVRDSAKSPKEIGAEIARADSGLAKMVSQSEGERDGRATWTGEFELDRGRYKIRGKHLVVKKDDKHTLVFTCTAEAERWGELGPLFDASLDTIEIY
jgi:hypothetical protein